MNANLPSPVNSVGIHNPYRDNIGTNARWVELRLDKDGKRTRKVKTKIYPVNLPGTVNQRKRDRRKARNK